MDASFSAAISNLNSLTLFSLFLITLEEGLQRYDPWRDSLHDRQGYSALALALELCMGVTMIIILLRFLTLAL